MESPTDAAPVPARGSTGQPVPREAPQPSFTAAGNEPFWSVKVDGSTLTYSTPELQPGKVFAAQHQAQANGARFTGKDGDKVFTLDIQRASCVDSMSGKAFEFTATFDYGEEHMTGCASSGS
ncbi:COG3650 family protein [Montanilutibacter psychrotolerans]|uniref:Uncharacterized protein n=1 Tax=Montanilutibacter psychrotolerans TaxID=1327343 RepID=A0A3M8SKM6_9GAMM|nr:hypothetical protein [Lysobacter psychrotolerans]RNF81851.1 hypothetical protein EER27_16375 [Lysobacter psychrotolerans]